MEDNKENINKVVLVSDDEQIEKQGPHLTFQGYGKSVSHFKYWLLGVTACMGVIGYLVTKFAVNPSREKMTTNITANIALSEDESTYLNGKSFAFSDILSKENIDEVIEKNPGYSKLSYDLFASNQTFTINQQTITENNVTTPLERKFTINTSLKVFSSSDQAKSFVSDLLANIENKAKDGINAFQYKNVLPTDEAFLSSMEFSDIISELTEQYTYLESSYKDMTSFFGSYTIVNGKTLDEYYSNFKANLTQNTFSSLKGKLNASKYVNLSSMNDVKDKIEQYDNLCASYQVQFKDIIATIESDKEVLKILSSNTTESVGAKISQITDEIAQLESKKREMIQTLTDLGYRVTDTGSEIKVDGYDDTNTNTYLYKLKNADQNYIDDCISFRNDLTDMYKKLNQVTQNASDTYRRAYLLSKKNEIITNETSVSGHISSALVALISAAVTFGIVSFVLSEVYINMEYNKQNKMKE